MTRFRRVLLNARSLVATIVAVAFVLFLQTPASAENWDLFVPELLVRYAAPMISVPYVIGVLSALGFKRFRSRAALGSSFLLSVIASLPALLALMCAGRSVQQAIKELGPYFLLNVVLLCFVWLAPIIQYRWLNKN